MSGSAWAITALLGLGLLSAITTELRNIRKVLERERNPR